MVEIPEEGRGSEETKVEQTGLAARISRVVGAFQDEFAMSLLDEIVRTKAAEIEQRKGQVPLSELITRFSTDQLPVLSDALATPGIHIIAEIKYCSPSFGRFACQEPPETIGEEYVKGGATAISVVTDEPYFAGRLEFLDRIRNLFSGSGRERNRGGEAEAVLEPVPLLRKDFILDRYQLAEARSHGASAALLIVSCLGRARLGELLNRCQDFGIEALVEIHSARELEIALHSGARLLGVNNRNLENFEVDIQTSFEIARLMEGESGYILVAESGISDAVAILELRDAGFSGFLVGTCLMSSSNPGQALRKLVSADPRQELTS